MFGVEMSSSGGSGWVDDVVGWGYPPWGVLVCLSYFDSAACGLGCLQNIHTKWVAGKIQLLKGLVGEELVGAFFDLYIQYRRLGGTGTSGGSC